MGDEWELMTLKKAGVSLIDCVHKTPPDAGDGYPYIAIPQMKAGQIDFHASPRLISESDFIEWTKKAYPQENDVVLSRRCNPGETAHVPPKVRFALGQNLVLLRSDSKNVYPPFLRWLTKNSQWWGQVNKFLNVGAIFDSLKCVDVPNFELLIPPLPEQKSIAHILGSLDDKIQLNRQMNTTLEAMAQALFKSWFVDFDPVIDKALAAGNPIPESFHKRAEARKALGERRKPLPADILRSTFPDRFVCNEKMGWRPEGWEVVSIYDLIKVVYGAPFQSKHFNSDEAGKPIIRIRDLKTGSPQMWSEEVHPKGTLISAGDVVAGMDAEFRSTLWYGEDGFLNQRLFLAKPLYKGVNSFYVQMILKPLLAHEEISQVGTTVAHLGKKDIDRFLVLSPGQLISTRYSEMTNAVLKKWIVNHRQNNTLTTLRDTLLPKLLSGQLRIPDAEKLIGETAQPPR